MQNTGRCVCERPAKIKAPISGGFCEKITPSDFSSPSQGRYHEGLATECLSVSHFLYLL